jgi:hypothetical protein
MTDTAKELLALSDSELLKYCRDDAGKWAAAFSTIKSAQGWGSNDIDEALMTTWFANAIEQATSCRLSARQQASVEEVAQTLDPSAFVDLGPGFKRAQKIEMELVTLKASALLAKYDIFQKVEG